MTDKQKLTVKALVGFLMPREVHHGDCLGADDEFHDIVEEITKACIFVHPPRNSSNRAWRLGSYVFKTQPYLVRNDAIIASADLMLAVPFGFEERLRSGTWATIRHTRKAKKPLIIVWPDGSYTPEGDLQFMEKCARILDELRK